MKKIYEFPEVTVFNVGVTEQVIATSTGFAVTGSSDYTINNEGNGGDVWGNSNSFDDQATPWYRR